VVSITYSAQPLPPKTLHATCEETYISPKRFPSNPSRYRDQRIPRASEMCACVSQSINPEPHTRYFEGRDPSSKTHYSFLSPRNDRPIQLLPWCDSAQTPITLANESQSMLNLYSGGGTNPSVLYNSLSSLWALNACGSWFLLSDG
jgi:hypothetical protein